MEQICWEICFCIESKALIMPTTELQNQGIRKIQSVKNDRLLKEVLNFIDIEIDEEAIVPVSIAQKFQFMKQGNKSRTETILQTKNTLMKSIDGKTHNLVWKNKI